MDSSSSPPARFSTRNAESTASQFLCGQQETANHIARLTNEVAGEDDRTIFLTFSRGYPVFAAELHGYFTRRYGDIIQVIHMGEDGGEGQARYTRIVLHSADDIPEIFSDGGCRLMRFAINGKHVWARTLKYYGVSP